MDGDVWPDLLLAGHEFEEWPTTIYWGGPTGIYRADRRTVLPGVEVWGIVLDIDAEDLDGDGLREVVLNRTRSDPFYQGYYIQIIAGLGDRMFADETTSWIADGSIRTGSGSDGSGSRTPTATATGTS